MTWYTATIALTEGWVTLQKLCDRLIHISDYHTDLGGEIQGGSKYFNTTLKYKFRGGGGGGGPNISKYMDRGKRYWGGGKIQRGSKYFNTTLKYKFRGVQIFRNIWTGGNHIGGGGKIQRGSKYFNTTLKYNYWGIQIFRNIWTGGDHTGGGGVQICQDMISYSLLIDLNRSLQPNVLE